MEVNFETISYKMDDGIGHLVINDPPANKMTPVFFKELNRLVRQYIAHCGAKGILVYGQGRQFSSGADVTLLLKFISDYVMLDEEDNVTAYPVWFIENRNTFFFLNRLQIPVISAIKGFCVGSGLELALCTHIRVGAKGSIYGLVESTFGFLPGAAGTERLNAVLGLGKATELILSGETIFADDALVLGLVDKIVEKNETLEYAENLLRYIINDVKEYKREEIPEYINDFDNKTL